MGASLEVVRLFGIPVRLHWTFAPLFLWLASTHYSFDGAVNWVDLGWTMAAVTALFLCVLLHELGHALSARRYGVKTQRILLMPIGGLAILDRLPDKPLHELIVAAAGPLTNLALALVLLPFVLLLSGDNVEAIIGYWVYPQGNYFAHDASRLDYLLVGLVALNILVAVFNLIPAFPMDGGRILRALIAMSRPRIQATTIAVRIGQAIAVVLVFISIPAFNWLMALAAAFIFFSAAFELKLMREDYLLQHHSVGDAARYSFTKVYSTDYFGEIDDVFRYKTKDDYLFVFDEWQNFVGILDGDVMLAAIRENGESYSTQVNKAKLLHPPSLTLDDKLQNAAQILSDTDWKLLPVSDRNGKLVAVISKEILNRYLRSAKWKLLG